LVTTGGTNHPVHLHGHGFVVQTLGGSRERIHPGSNEYGSILTDITTVNYVNPPRRDVVRVSNTGVTVRFRVNYYTLLSTLVFDSSIATSNGTLKLDWQWFLPMRQTRCAVACKR
ncbi:unnamed protein product, partial [Rhizoctonia solani]